VDHAASICMVKKCWYRTTTLHGVTIQKISSSNGNMITNSSGFVRIQVGSNISKIQVQTVAVTSRYSFTTCKMKKYIIFKLTSHSVAENVYGLFPENLTPVCISHHFDFILHEIQMKSLTT
jgi:hypothetical protein